MLFLIGMTLMIMAWRTGMFEAGMGIPGGVIVLFAVFAFWPKPYVDYEPESSTGFNANDARSMTKTREEMKAEAERIRRESIASVPGRLEECFTKIWEPGIKRAAMQGVRRAYFSHTEIPIDDRSQEETEMMLRFIRSKGFHPYFTPGDGGGWTGTYSSLIISW